MRHEGTAAEVAKAVAAIRATADRMRNNPRFTCTFKEYAFLDDAALRDMESILSEEMGIEDFRMPENLRKIYQATGGFRFQWQFLDPPAPPLNGSVEIASPLEIFQREGEPAPSQLVLTQDRIFDFVSDDDLVLIRLNGSQQISTMTMQDQDEGRSWRLSLDPAAYLFELAEHCAIYRWQRFFCAGAFSDAEAKRLDDQLDTVLRALGEND